MDAIESRIEAAKKKLKQLTAQKQQLEGRKKAAESKPKRTDDTRRKILSGAAILAKVQRGERSPLDGARTRLDSAAVQRFSQLGLTVVTFD